MDASEAVYTTLYLLADSRVALWYCVLGIWSIPALMLVFRVVDEIRIRRAKAKKRA
jgi:hypothetical protein